ncbi:hypothetical protein AB0I51_46645 [Streptomyces sp. NPDC050549]|uniref:hypothetical protein n=1 Tax=Streptomyces sp. NPDC050549 TaxID=3155406 RepID=UPI00342B25E0
MGLEQFDLGHGEIFPRIVGPYRSAQGPAQPGDGLGEQTGITRASAARFPLPVIGALVAVISCKLIAAHPGHPQRPAVGPRARPVILLTFLATTQAPLDQALAVALGASMLARLTGPFRSVHRNTMAAFSRP